MKKRRKKKKDGRFIHGGRRTIPVIAAATGARFTPARARLTHSHRRTTIRCRARARFLAEKYVDRSIMNEIFNVLTRSPHANHGQTGLRPRVSSLNRSLVFSKEIWDHRV